MGVNLDCKFVKLQQKIHLCGKKLFQAKIWSRELTQERFPEPLTPLAWTSIADIFVSNVRILNERFGIIVKNINEIGVCFGGYVYANPCI